MKIELYTILWRWNTEELRSLNHWAKEVIWIVFRIMV